MSTPLVSIIIPNYNEERFIAKTIESACEQTYENLEIIVVDDGSSDNSPKIIEEYLNRDSRIIFLRQENMNASIARNRAIEHAKGDYFYFLDSDDIVYPDSILKMVTVALEKEADLVIGNMNEIDEDGNLVVADRFFQSNGESCCFYDFIDILPAPPNKLFNASVIRNNHLTFGNVRIGQDLNFYLKYLLCCKKISFLADMIYGWRLVPNSMTHATNFRLFDIVYSFEDVKKFYQKNDALNYYYDYIRMIEYHTYYRQMDKQRNFYTLAERKLVVDFFKYYLRKLGNVRECKNANAYFDAIRKCETKLKFPMIYTSKAYQLFYRVKNR